MIEASVPSFNSSQFKPSKISRVREILKFAQSLLALLSEVHNTGIFRASKIRMDLSDIPDGHLSPKLLDISKNGQVIIYDGAKL